MSRDSFLFLIIGILIGFLAGYILQEEMADRQPQRLVHGEGAEAVAMPAGPMMQEPGGGGGGGAAAAGGGPAMPIVRELTARINENPNDAEAILELANLNFDINNWQRCQELYTRYLALRPNSPDVLSDLGVTYRALGNFDQALATFDQSLKQAPDHWLARFNKAIVLGIDLQRYDEALAAIEELKQQRPDDEQVQRLAAEVARRKAQG